MVTELHNDPCKSHSIQDIHHRLRCRRLYDLANIFNVIGCATRMNSTEIIWHGTSQILPQLLAEKRRVGVTNFHISLIELFPPENCVGFASLAMALLLMFPAMGTLVINLRQLSTFFSIDQQRFKTTLCKFYHAK
jgi:hypothetical protein